MDEQIEAGPGAGTQVESEAPGGGADAGAVSEAVTPPSSAETSAEAGPTPSPAAHSAPGTAPASFPSADKFNWLEWDQKVESLPESVRPWGQQIYDSRQAWFEREIERRQQEQFELKSIYDELISSNADPRLAPLQEKHSALEAKYGELETNYNTIKSEYEEYTAAIEEQIRAEGKRIADEFQAAHPEIFDGAEQQKLFGVLLEEDWDLDSIPKVMGLGAEAQSVARKAKMDGVPDGYALQLAERLRSKPAKPRPGAQLTSGSDGSPPSSHVTGPGKGDAMTIDDRRNHAASRALKLHSGGRS